MEPDLSPDPLESLPAGTRGKQRRKSALRELLDALVIAIILALLVRTWVVQVFRIPSTSMEDSLLVGDHVLVNKFIFAPTSFPFERALLPVRSLQRGDVAIFKFPPNPQRIFIKRCVAGPREKVEIIKKRLFVDGHELEEAGYSLHRDPRVYDRSLILDDGYRKRDNFGPFVVPEGYFFFLGDNRDESFDSRFWGPVPEVNLKGRPWLVLWSTKQDGAKTTLRRRSLRLVR